jgi:hypothetical protein
MLLISWGCKNACSQTSEYDGKWWRYNAGTCPHQKLQTEKQIERKKEEYTISIQKITVI